MGLLDGLNQGGGYGGLLDFLFNGSPALKANDQQPQYDAMGNYTGTVQSDSSPFPKLPDANYAQFATPSAATVPFSVFNQGAAPISGVPAAPPMQPTAQSAPPTPSAPPQNTIGVGGYQMPRIGDMAQFMPQVPTDVSAQSRQPAPQPMPQQSQSLPPALQSDSILGRIGAPDGLIARLTGNDTKSAAKQNLKAQYDALVPLLGQQKALAAVLNPKAAEILLTQAYGNKEPPKTVEEFAVRNAWENRNGTAPRAGGTVGGGSDAGLPTTLDALEKYKTDQKAAEKRATTIAEEQGKLAVSLPDTLARAEEAIKQIDQVKAHNAKWYRTGAASLLPALPGTRGTDFDERVNQLKGQAFLQAYNQLRGTGSISEKEGAKAEQAQARLSQAKSQADFDSALDDLRSVLVTGYSNAQKKAGEEKVTPYQMPVGQSRSFGNVTIRRIN